MTADAAAGIGELLGSSWSVSAFVGGFATHIPAAVAFLCGRKRVMAVMKHRTFDTALRTSGIGEEGYEKPNNAQIENT